ncbi:MAG: aldehyde ferredoxin oxidoreductase C-terminal domain-containing protein [Thermacetogeniaceae bacterium]|jgi:aldehyde:ferredoxin oxidoreductase
MLKVVRVNMRTQEINIKKFDMNTTFGNRGLVAKTLIEEVDPKCDPLGAANKLVFATGLFAGYNFPTGNRLSAGAKSPLTETIKESNVGGIAGTNIARHGIKMIIIEDKPPDDTWYLLRIAADGVITLESAEKYVTKGTHSTAKALQAEYGGKRTAVCVVGPGGERMHKAASIQATDLMTGTACRSCGRGGMGAVMGSKHLKAIVIERAKDKARLPMADEAKTKELIKEIVRAANADPGILKMYGTNVSSMLTIPMNAYPSRNFSGRMISENDADRIGIAGYVERINQYGGKQGIACQPGCPIKCSNHYHDETGEMVTSALEYETIAMSGPNCDIYDWDYIAYFDYICDDVGVDTIEIGNAIAIAMDAGYIPWGDEKAAKRVLQEMKRGVGFGNVLGNGAQAVGDYLKHDRIPTCKGQAFPAYDPRSIKGMGVSYATSTQGADHTAGMTLGLPIDHEDPSIQVEESRKAQINAATIDNMLCLLAASVLSQPGVGENVVQLLSAVYGVPLMSDMFEAVGRQTLEWERKFNEGAGITRKDSIIPSFLREQPIESGQTFDVEQTEIDNTL